MKTIVSIAALNAAYMSEIAETVTIMQDGNPVRINKADYDPDTHGKLAKDENPASVQVMATTNTPGPELVAPAVPASAPLFGAADPATLVTEGVSTAAQPSELDRPVLLGEPKSPVSGPAPEFVTKSGSKYFVTDSNGDKITRNGIEDKGYKTEGDAWTAIMAAPPVA